jgi:anti-anti-sigma regulatory factor
MSSKKKETKKLAQFKIEGVLSVYEVGSLRDELLGYLIENDGLELDLSKVSECDAAGIQFLISAQKTFDVAGKKLTLREVSGAVKETAIGTGIDFENQIYHERGI